MFFLFQLSAGTKVLCLHKNLHKGNVSPQWYVHEQIDIITNTKVGLKLLLSREINTLGYNSSESASLNERHDYQVSCKL